MDKELLRIAIIGTGLIIMVAMVISGYLKDKQAHEDDDDYYDDDEEFDDDDFDDEPVKKPSLIQNLKDTYFQKIQHHQKEANPVVEREVLAQFDDEEDEEIEEEHQRPASAQSILQFSVITRGRDDFNVADVFHTLEELDMEYGSLQIFERIDEQRLVQFGVVSMVDPGTFPNTDLENYYCPGVVFFMQFDGLKNPKAVFDDYVHTAVVFASQMDGVVLDHRRQPLTDAMVDAIRDNL